VLAILSTHPIQYQVPLWQALAKDGQVPFEVWYMTSHAVGPSRDPQFGKDFAWDLDMLVGYPYRFLEVAASARPGSFLGCRLTERLRDRIRARGAKALWIQGWQVMGYWQAIWEAKAAGIEVWLRAESNDLAPVAWWKWPIKRLLLSHLFNRVDKFFYIGSANRRLYKKFGVPEEKLFSAPYAVDNERFAAQANQIRNSKVEIRKQWGIPDDAYCILFCGKFIPKKRPFDLIKAAQLLTTDNSLTDNRTTNVHLLFVGSGELGNQMREHCNVVFDAERATTDNRERITDNQKPRASFAGFLNQTEISRAYVAADVLVLSSDYGETWGLVVNEAMASGLPSIVSNQCGCAEDLATTPPNKIFPCGDITELTNCLIESSPRRLSTIPAADLVDRYSFAATVRTVVQCAG
jgi:glycosyltransferase involved in cell wall biosynthesis